MNKADFTDLLKNPEKLGTEHIETLRKIVTDFPFFSTAHVLLAKALANTNHYEYEKQLKITALLTGDRAVLYQFITGNKDQEGDIEAFNVPLELKVEKVSKPDFVITEEEAHEAELLDQANSLLEEAEAAFNSEAETNEAEINNVETTTIEEVNTDNTNQIKYEGEKVADIGEVIATNEDSDQVVNELPLVEHEELVVEENNDLVSEEILDEAKDEVLVIESSQDVIHEFTAEELEPAEESKQPIEIVNEVDEIPQDIIETVVSVEQKEEIVSDVDNNSYEASTENEQSTDNLVAVELNTNAKEKAFQLAETEGTLVRFRGNFSEEILQDFDETSLEDNKENIVTVTQFVAPVTPKEEQTFLSPNIEEVNNQNDLYETKVDEFEDDIAENIVAEQESVSEKPIDIEEPIDNINSHLEDTVEEGISEIIEQPVFAVEPVIPVSLDELLEKYNDELDEEPPFIVNDFVPENKSEESVFDLIEKEEIAEVNEIANNDYNTVNEGGLSFIDWLNKNKAESDQSKNKETKIETKTSTSVEDDEFTLYIQHLIKTKAESTLAKNIEAEIQFEPTDLQEEKEEPVAEKIVSAIELPDVDPRLIDEEEDEEEIIAINDITPVIEPFIVEPSETTLAVDKTDSDEDSTFEEIEAFEVNNTKEEAKEEKEPFVDTVIPPFIDEIYSAKVESILPDFEKLNAQSADVEEQHQSFFTFDETKDLAVDTEINSNTAQLEPNETVNFETEDLNEDLFNNSFMQIFPSGNSLVELNNEEKEPSNKIPQPKMEVESILEKFMRENPSITRPKAEFFNPVNVAKLSIEEKDEIVSETLASIYLKQGLVKKAISTYEKLSLIYPHKIAYFAALIKQLKTEHNIN